MKTMRSKWLLGLGIVLILAGMACSYFYIEINNVVWALFMLICLGAGIFLVAKQVITPFKPVCPEVAERNRLRRERDLKWVDTAMTVTKRIFGAFVLFSTGVLIIIVGFYFYPFMLDWASTLLPFTHHNAVVQLVGTLLLGLTPLVVLLCILAWVTYFWGKAFVMMLSIGKVINHEP
jgi:hypothetical protein